MTSAAEPMFDIPREIPNEVQVHPSALVAERAKLGKGVRVGAFAIVGPDVILEDGVVVESHAIVEGVTTIGERSVLYSYSTVGAKPQDLKYGGESTRLVVGKRNSIRQYVNISIGTDGGGGTTKVGDDNLLMVYTHVGHDSQVGDGCVFANGVSLAGHVTVDSGVLLGGHTAVHQFCRVGELALTAGGAIVTQDVPPFCIVHGNRAEANGLNLVGLKRRGVAGERIAQIKKMYRLLFRGGLTVAQAIEQTVAEVEPSPYREQWIRFLRESERGLCR